MFFYGPLMSTHETVLSISLTSYYYYNRFETWAHSYGYHDQATGHSHVDSSCYNGGTALLACGVLAFVSVTMKLLLSSFRRLHYSHVVPMIGGDKTSYFKVEVLLAFFNLLFFFLMSVVWGTTCYKALESENDGDSFELKPTGFAYICVCTVFALLALLMTLYLRRKILDSPGFVSQPPQPPSPRVEQNDAL